MDKLTQFIGAIERVLGRHLELCGDRPNASVESFLIVDELKRSFIWMNVGWERSRRVMGMTVYLRIRDDKIWVEEDLTEEGIANELVGEGIAKSDIVLAFQDPQLRQFTEFAAVV
ncbi:MAG: XisI protein [Cyanobacteria bacterium P01_D01_bin.73]